MTEETKVNIPVDTPRRVRYSALILAAALAMVVILSVQIFSRIQPVEVLGSKKINRPYSRADELVRQGWRLYRDQADVVQAERNFREAMRLEPYHKAAIDGCAQMALLNRDYERAYKLFFQYHDLSNKDFRSYANLSITLLMMNRFNEAERYAEEAVTKHNLENDFQFSLIRASVQQALGKTDKAEALLQKAIENGGKERVGSMVQRLVWAEGLKELKGYSGLNPDRKRETE